MTADHPAGIGNMDLWFGIECEGVMSGMLTAFVAAKLNEGKLDILKSKFVSHIFMTELFSDWEWFAEVLLPIAEETRASLTVAIPPEKVNDMLSLPFADKIRLMIRVNIPTFHWFKMLRGTDEISIGAPYTLAVAARDAFIISEPSDYISDYIVEANK